MKKKHRKQLQTWLMLMRLACMAFSHFKKNDWPWRLFKVDKMFSHLVHLLPGWWCASNFTNKKHSAYQHDWFTLNVIDKRLVQSPLSSGRGIPLYKHFLWALYQMKCQASASYCLP